MRKDIEIHINTGDITLNPKCDGIIRDFCWVDTPTGMEQSFIYGEITIPAYNIEDSIVKNGVYVSIPYTPVYKKIKLRFKREYSSTNFTYIRNPKDGSDWFSVQAIMFGCQARDICASELITISEDKYYLAFNEGEVNLYSGYNSDLRIIKANQQNRNLLLRCVPGNNYRYPLIGVGLVRWSNGNLNVSNLAEILKEQFIEDGTPVKNAQYDFNTHQLYIDIDTSNVDENGDV